MYTSRQNMYNKRETFVFCQKRLKLVSPTTEEAGLNPPAALMYSKPNYANNFKNNCYNR